MEDEEAPPKGMLHLIYQPLATRHRQYAEWLLLRRHGPYFPLPIHRADDSKLVFESMLALENTLVVPQAAAVVL
jgi:hypothetical protein